MDNIGLLFLSKIKMTTLAKQLSITKLTYFLARFIKIEFAYSVELEVRSKFRITNYTQPNLIPKVFLLGC